MKENKNENYTSNEQATQLDEGWVGYLVDQILYRIARKCGIILLSFQ